jgi:hypothetical protein
LNEFFEIQNKYGLQLSQLGFLHRLRPGSYHFVEEISELKASALYYIYFKEAIPEV